MSQPSSWWSCRSASRSARLCRPGRGVHGASHRGRPRCRAGHLVPAGRVDPMTQVTVAQPAEDTVLSAAQPLRVTEMAMGKGGLEPDVVDAVTVSFDATSPVEA